MGLDYSAMVYFFMAYLCLGGEKYSVNGRHQVTCSNLLQCWRVSRVL